MLVNFMLVKKSVFYYNSDVSNGFLSKTIKKKTHTHTQNYRYFAF